MKHGSLFSGIGGFDLAARWMGWDNVFACEVDSFCQAVLEHHFPESTIYHDVKQFPTDESPRCDILSGGFPCQPYSQAGLRRGDDDPRHLWPYMRDIIDALRPTWVVGENVRGLLSWNDGRVHAEVLDDLQALGYEVGTFVLPAVSQGAPHRRDRVWIVADCHPLRTARGPERDEGTGRGGRLRQSHEIQHALESGGVLSRIAEELSRTAPNANRSTEQSKPSGRQGQGQPIRRSRGGGASFWDGFPSVPAICRGDDGLPTGLDGLTFPKWRRESVKAYGNAIVPQVAYQIFKAIQMVEDVTMERPEPPSRTS